MSWNAPSFLRGSVPGPRRAPGAARLLLVSALVVGCASPGGRIGTATRVTVHDYRAGNVFELVSRSHTDPVAYYSQPRDDAARKIVSDDVMKALIEELDRQGFARNQKTGRAPSSTTVAALTWGMEIDRGGAAGHWVVGGGTDPKEHNAFRTTLQTFLSLYNQTSSYQVMENPSGADLFEKERAHVSAGDKR